MLFLRKKTIQFNSIIYYFKVYKVTIKKFVQHNGDTNAQFIDPHYDGIQIWIS